MPTTKVPLAAVLAELTAWPALSSTVAHAPATGPGLEPVVAGAVTVPETDEPPTKLALIPVAGVIADTEMVFAVLRLVWPRKYWRA